MKPLLVISVFILFTGCAQTPAKRDATIPEQIVGDVLTFNEQWPDDEQNLIRMYVTKDFIRIDQTPSNGEYQIFDRVKKQLIIVDDRQRQYQRINASNKFSNKTYQWQKEISDSFILPRHSPGDDTKAVHYQYSLNDENCLHIVALDNMLEDSQQALRELREMRALGGLIELLTDNDYRAACFNAVHIHQPEIAFENGFPMREWSDGWGYQRFLQDAKEGAVLNKDMFKIPDGYAER